jgi:hypothetical protein
VLERTLTKWLEWKPVLGPSWEGSTDRVTLTDRRGPSIASPES